jgi:hypothetical protein
VELAEGFLIVIRLRRFVTSAALSTPRFRLELARAVPPSSGGCFLFGGGIYYLCRVSIKEVRYVASVGAIASHGFAASQFACEVTARPCCDVACHQTDDHPGGVARGVVHPNGAAGG